jgi:hypothetical protein
MNDHVDRSLAAYYIMRYDEIQHVTGKIRNFEDAAQLALAAISLALTIPI